MKKDTHNRTQSALTKIFIIGSSLLLMINVVGLYHDYQKLANYRRIFGVQQIGTSFAGLKEVIGPQKIIGYYSDKNEDDSAASQEFAHAQYVLAPIVLDLNNLNHEYTLFVCSSPEIAWNKIKEIGAVPYKANGAGMILARKTP